MPTKSKIQDQTFLFTGTLTEFTREEAEELVEYNGGKVLSVVTAKLNYLVVGTDAGSKLDKAKELGTVKILTEKAFLKLVPKAATTKASSKKTITTKMAPAKKVVSPTKVEASKSATKKSVASKETRSLEEVTIGKQVWMAKNLDVTHFRNGDAIPEAKTAAEWQKAGLEKKSAWCYYDGKKENDKLYGKLYNSYAANDPRGLAPHGWMIPSDKDWKKLEKHLHENDAGYYLKSKDGWKSQSVIQHDEHLCPFDGKPAGVRYTSGTYSGIGEHVAYLTSKVKKNEEVVIRYLQDYSDLLGEGSDDQSNGYYVRCIKE